ncbi:hypothetical protein [Candidatus Viridilinea mediisalina]|uniref:hypothetical protein n=1 Tax=Candidatus Viridilinea mediisalina TaxID=2024553 RepID=UPI0013FD3D91|nr:hypothetical protein [Candidatus Viridilinea mediisalina]
MIAVVDTSLVEDADSATVNQLRALLRQSENLETFLNAFGTNVPITDDLRQRVERTLDLLSAELEANRTLVLPMNNAELQERFAAVLEDIEAAITLTHGGLRHPTGDEPRLGLARTRIRRAIGGLQEIIAFLTPQLRNLPSGDGKTIVFISEGQTYSLRLDSGLLQEVAAKPITPLALRSDGTPYWVSIDGPLDDPFSPPPFRIMQGGTRQQEVHAMLQSSDLSNSSFREATGSPWQITLSSDETQLYFDTCTSGLNASCAYYAFNLASQTLNQLSFTSVSPGWITPDGQKAMLFLDNPYWNPGSEVPGSDHRYGYSIVEQGQWDYNLLPIDSWIEDLVWLFDSRFIYISSSGDETLQSKQLILAHTDGSTAQILMNDFPATTLLLAPDGGQVAFVNPASGLLTLLDVGTLQVATVATLPQDAQLVVWR